MEDVRKFMPVYIGSYLKNTMHLSTEEHGAYLLLLLHGWCHPIPDDDAELSRITRLPPERWAAIRKRIQAFFWIDRGRWRNARQEAELTRARANATRAARAGKASASQRAGKLDSPDQSAEFSRQNGGFFAQNSQGAPAASEFPLASSWPPSTAPSPSPTDSSDLSRSGAGAPLKLVHDSEQAPIPPADPQGDQLSHKARIFRYALPWLARATGQTDTALRSFVGRMIRDYGELWTLEALRRAQREKAIEPKAFAEGCLRSWKEKGFPGETSPSGMASAARIGGVK